MADKSGEADIRSLDVDKIAKGYADEEIKLLKYARKATTKSREIRWFQKTAGYLDSNMTDGITASRISNASSVARPVIVEQSWTRMTSTVQDFTVESPMFSNSDLADNDVDLLLTNIRDLVRAVEQRKAVRFWNTLSENGTAVNLNTVAITNEWDDYANATIIADIDNAKGQIRSFGYNPNNCILLLNDNEHSYLFNWIVVTHGSKAPEFASALIKGGKVEMFMGLGVDVDINVTADKAMIFTPGLTCAWKSFSETQAARIIEPLIGQKIRVTSAGEAILEHPKSACLLTNVGPS